MPTATVPQAFALALQHHQAGQLAEAEALYRQIVAMQPQHAEARHHLGIVACQASRHEIGAKLLRQGISSRRRRLKAAWIFQLSPIGSDIETAERLCSYTTSYNPADTRCHLRTGG